MIYFRETLPTVNGVWLEERIDAEAVNFIEVCSDPDDTIYRFGHIPGGNRFFWKDLCWHKTGHEFVTPAELAGRPEEADIAESNQLVLYGDPMQYGTYAFWELAMVAHPVLTLPYGDARNGLTTGEPLAPRCRHLE